MRLLNNIEEILIVPTFAIMSLLVFTQVVFRFILKAALPWSEELLRFLFIWSILIGSSIGIKRGAHLGVNMFVDLLPMKIRRIVKIFVCVMIETFCVLMIYASYGLVVLQMSSNQLSPAMRVPMYFGTLAIPIGFALIFVRVIQLAKKEVFG